MSGVALGLEVPACLLLAFLLLCKYGDVKRQHKVVLTATLLAWTLCFIIVATIPLDVTTTIYRQCLYRNSQKLPQGVNATTTTITTTTITTKDNQSFTTTTRTTDASPMSVCKKPWSYVPDRVLPTFWHVVYWTSQFLTWLLLPFMQSYAAAGDFTVSGKVRTALVENAIYYGSYLLIFLSLLLYAIAHPSLHLTGSQLRVIGITASNTWGLLLLVLLMGYGLVELPRAHWTRGHPQRALTKALFHCSRLAGERAEAAENLEDLAEEIKKLSEVIKYNHPLRRHLDTIISKFSAPVQESMFRSLEDFEEMEGQSPSLPSLKSLAKTHKQVIKAVQRHHRTELAWEALLEEALMLQDTVTCSGSPSRTFAHSTPGSSSRSRAVWLTPSMEWWWRCRLHPWLSRLTCLLLSLLSTIVVWTECSFFSTKPVLSVFALIISHAEARENYLAIEMMSLLTIAYLSVCTFSTVFRIRLFNLYHLAPHHQTNHHSLLFSGMLFCRLTPPLCLNFLGLIHIDTHISQHTHIETAYTQLMGHMDVISFMADGFYLYYPITIVLVCLATYFTMGSRLLKLLGFQQFIGDDDMTSDLIEEGTELLRREKRRRQRQEDGDTRRKEWRDRYGAHRESPGSTTASGTTATTTTTAAARSGRITARSTSGETQQKTPRVCGGVADCDRVELLRDVEPLDFNAEDAPDDTDSSRYQTSGRYSSLSRGKNIFDDV